MLDTWATSSLTPKLAANQFKDKPIYDKIYPMSLRPQAHDIITFWLFNTVVKSRMHDRVNPWSDVVISGHAQDPHGKKMSKSKGNVVEPQEMIEKYNADCLRFWAAGCKLGDDLPFSEKDLATGQKFMTKLWNASKFVYMHLKEYEPGEPGKLEKVDKWLLTRLSNIIVESTESFDQYEYFRTKADVEKFFWQTFCDNYLELVKARLYKPEIYGMESRRSAQYTLYTGLQAVLKLMAPIMPHITEEIYQAYFIGHEDVKSIHNSSWPSEIMADEESLRQGDVLVEVLALVRKEKTGNQMSLAKEVEKAAVTIPDEKRRLLEPVEADLKAAGKINEISYRAGDELIIDFA